MSARAATDNRVLVAGIGNVFLGDDGFGVEVVRRIDPADLPDGADVVDYGIRGVHLAYELLDGRYAALVMVDAVPMNEPPGTLAVFEVGCDEPDDEDASQETFAAPLVEAHSMNPDAVLGTLRGLGGTIDRVLVVGCQPAAFDGGMELSQPVRAAVGAAVRMVTDVVADLLRGGAVDDQPEPAFSSGVG